jgi:3-oxoacyl-[acyl-carrier protein] reductase
MKMLSGKTALVTSASRGIGRAIACRLAAEGAMTGVHYGSNDDAARETLEAIRKAGAQAFTVKADLSLDGSVDVLFGKLAAELDGQPLDILVNNAAIGGLMGGIAGTTRGEFDSVFAVIARAPFFIIQRALPLMRDGGRIINISSADTRSPSRAR